MSIGKFSVKFEEQCFKFQVYSIPSAYVDMI